MITRIFWSYILFIVLLINKNNSVFGRGYPWEKPQVQLPHESAETNIAAVWKPWIGFPLQYQCLEIYQLAKSILVQSRHLQSPFETVDPLWFTFDARPDTAAAATKYPNFVYLYSAIKRQIGFQATLDTGYNSLFLAQQQFPYKGRQDFRPIIFVKETVPYLTTAETKYPVRGDKVKPFEENKLRSWLLRSLKADGIMLIVPEAIFAKSRYHITALQIATSVVLSLEKLLKMSNPYQHIMDVTTDMYTKKGGYPWLVSTHGYTLTSHLYYANLISTKPELRNYNAFVVGFEVHQQISVHEPYKSSLNNAFKDYKLGYYMNGILVNYTNIRHGDLDCKVYLYECDVSNRKFASPKLIEFAQHGNKAACADSAGLRMMRQTSAQSPDARLRLPRDKHMVFYLSADQYFLYKGLGRSNQTHQDQYNWYKPQAGRDICTMFLTDQKLSNYNLHVHSKRFFYDHIKDETGADYADQFMMTYVLCRQYMISEKIAYRNEQAFNYQLTTKQQKKSVGILFMIPETFSNPIFYAEVERYLAIVSKWNINLLKEAYRLTLTSVTYGRESMVGEFYYCVPDKENNLKKPLSDMAKLSDTVILDDQYTEKALLSCVLSDHLRGLDRRIVVVFAENIFSKSACPQKSNEKHYIQQATDVLLVTDGNSHLHPPIEAEGKVKVLSDYHSLEKMLEISLSKLLTDRLKE